MLNTTRLLASYILYNKWFSAVFGCPIHTLMHSPNLFERILAIMFKNDLFEQILGITFKLEKYFSMRLIE